MGIKCANCKNCGGQLTRNEDNELYCPSCGSKYLEQEDINNTYINNKVVKNYFAPEPESEKTKEKVDGYLLQVVNSMCAANYSEAKNYCISIIRKDPFNLPAVIFKRFIESVKQSNGRFLKWFSPYEFFRLLKYVSDDLDVTNDYSIFPYLEMILSNLYSSPKEEFIDYCDNFLSNFEAINNNEVQSFVTALRDYRDEMQLEYDELQANIEKLSRKERRLNEVLKTQRLLKFAFFCIMILMVIAFFYAIR